jgi:O-methyltransferase involved in polyketide biosynthesis
MDLGSVQKTLLLPLWGRAVEARKPNPLLVDRAAADVLTAIDYDFSTIARNISFISQLAWIARSLHTDRTIGEFLARNPEATLVNLGCGLDTTFERVDNDRLRWYDLDLPDVIELRKRLIPERERRKLLAFSLLDDGWLRQIDARGPTFFLASGVLYLADTFPGSEIVFDACSPRGLRIANRKVIKAGGMDETAVLKWGLRRARDMETWDRRIAVLAEYPIFRRLKHRLSLKERWGMLLSDVLGIMSMVHLRLGTPRDC